MYFAIAASDVYSRKNASASVTDVVSVEIILISDCRLLSSVSVPPLILAPSPGEIVDAFQLDNGNMIAFSFFICSRR